MSKTGWIILFVCLCLLFCICTGLFLAGRLADSSLFSGDTTTKDYKDLRNPYASDGVYAVKMSELKELDIDWISGSVVVEFTEGDSIRIQEKANSVIKESDALRYGVNGNKLRIQACKKNHLGKLPTKELIVSLPRTLAAELKELEIDTVSASVSAAKLDLVELEIDTVSGKVELQGIIADEAGMDSVSGDILLRGCSFDTLRVDSVSGLASLTGTARKVKTSSVSGSIQLWLDDSREVRVNTMSGSVSIDFVTVPKELQVDTTSGNASISLPKDASCNIKLDAMSGKLYLNEEPVGSRQITLGEGAANIDIDSMSGSVYIITK